MNKYTTDKKEPLGNPIPVRFKIGTAERIDNIHGNQQEFIRDAVEKLLDEQEEALKGLADV